MIPDNVEKIIMTKEDYDRNVEQLLYDKINAEQEVERLNNKLKDIKSQLDYLETYSSKEDVFEDMKRRLDRIESIVNGSDKEWIYINSFH